ncbi:MAG: TetR/AcrR family transcriptional regulator [Prevotella sp.]|nr:TetR/AcrR family transcriptional regulator [Prevotella sp.]
MQEKKTTTAYREGLKNQILATAMEAFAAQGIRAVKMDDIARTLTISKRTLYEIYSNKEVLLFETVRKKRSDGEQWIKERLAASANVIDIILQIYMQKAEEFRSTNQLFYTDLEKYPQILRFLRQDSQTQKLRLKQFLERGIDEGYFRRDVNTDLVMLSFEALGENIQRHSLYKLYTFDELFFNVFMVMLRGISTQQGIEEIDNSMKNIMK